MPGEYYQKEIEYGIRWRSVFKRELLEFAEETFKRCIDLDFIQSDDPFQFFRKIIKKDALNGAKFD